MYRFFLDRVEDESGISGIGKVAEGVVSANGKCVLFWLSAVRSVGVYDSVEEVINIHGHGGKTRVVWIDYPFDVGEPYRYGMENIK
jgi:hypothetical protein